MKNIFVIGHYGGNNLGDELMLESILDLLNSSSNVNEIRVVSKKVIDTYDNVQFTALKIGSVAKAILNSQILILGGGTHFHDEYITSRYRRHLLYLSKILIITLIFKLLGKKVAYIGMGFGPFTRRATSIITKICLALVDVVTIRDDKSAQRLKDNNIHVKNSNVGFDLVSMNPHLSDYVTGENNILGISITSFNYSNNKASDEVWNSIFTSIVEQFEKVDITIKIFIFRSGEKESDLPLSQELLDRLQVIDKNRVKLIFYDGRTQEFLNEVNSCKYFIATRYHSAVVAYLCNCHLLIIPYHNKLIDLLNTIQLSEQALLDIENTSNFSEKLNQLLQTNKNFKAQMPVSETISLTKESLIELYKLISHFSNQN